MKEELDKKLCKTFPKIFSQRGLPMTETCMPLGFSCGDGWYELIYSLCDKIQKHCDENDFQVEAVQVKEKFGGLRFYARGATDEVYELISKAESASYKTCEDCGTKEFVEVRNGEWIRTLCDECAGIERGYN